MGDITQTAKDKINLLLKKYSLPAIDFGNLRIVKEGLSWRWTDNKGVSIYTVNSLWKKLRSGHDSNEIRQYVETLPEFTDEDDKYILKTDNNLVISIKKGNNAVSEEEEVSDPKENARQLALDYARKHNKQYIVLFNKDGKWLAQYFDDNLEAISFKTFIRDKDGVSQIEIDSI